MGRFLESIRRHLRPRLIIWLFVVPAPPLLLTVWFAQQGYSLTSFPIAGSIIACIIAGMVFLARATNRVILAPLYRLAHAAESLKRGEPGMLPREPDRLDVIGVLQKKLADMVEAIRAREIQARDAEAQYHAAKDQLANVLEHAPDPIIFTDLNGNITLYNEGAERVLGHAASDVLGKPVTDLYLDPAERATALAELETSGEVIGREGWA